jgi:putative transposase
MLERGVLTLPESIWEEAVRRTDVIGRLAGQSIVGWAAAQEAGDQLEISRRQIYKLIKRFREGNGLVTDLAPGHSAGGKGKTRISREVENIIQEVIETFYLSRQKRSEAVVVREIWMRCSESGYRRPARNTVRARIALLDPRTVTQKRQGQDAARRFRPAAGKTPQPAGPLEVIQMDHTKIDVIVVDEISREPIGRASLTLAIDIFTRCIVGMLLTLEAPSATSVGLCLTHVVMDKAAWLARLGLTDMTWTMHGKPHVVYLDNAPEFKSEALKRGCEQHGIKLEYRPPKQPHFGGIIERVIGTAMKMVHELPGTTFSNTKERGSYNPDATAILTLRELEKWLTIAIGTYHESVHSALWEPPSCRWKKSIQSCRIFTVSDEKAFLIDFLPVLRRSIGRIGFVLDHISYYADVLKPWIARRDQLNQFVIRRDPRDLSRVWVLDPSSNQYFELPYRSLANPAITLWEHKKAVDKLRENGRAQVDEPAIFRMVTQMRQITETAAKERKRARREGARRNHLHPDPLPSVLEPPCTGQHSDEHVKRFDEIEEW